MFRNIVLAFDGSEYSHKALRCAKSISESILKVAENREADLIVMGTRGFGAVKGFLVGSVSRKVIHYAACPVMVVH